MEADAVMISDENTSHLEESRIDRQRAALRMGGEDINPPPDHEARIVVLTEKQIDKIAERVEDRFYARVGRRVVEKVLWAIGVGAAALMAWLAGKGLLK